MRPINLKLSAFGSFVNPTEINFESGLGGANIFLIHGSTGAGKTTILDAICYALYEESSGGGEGGGRDKSSFRSEFADDSQEMFVEFTFAMNNSVYRIKRIPPLKKGAKKLVELYQDNNLKTSDAAEANYCIKNLLGFNAAQFRQVVILPQGKFREFLIATSQKREELLSVIFNAGFYAQIEKALEEKAKAANAELKNLKTVQEKYLQDLDGEENFDDLVKNISAQVEELKISVGKNKIAAENARQDLLAGEILNNKFSQVEESQKKLQAAQENLKAITEKISPAQIEFEKRKAEEVTRQDLLQKIGDLQKISVAISEYQKNFANLEKFSQDEKVNKEKIANEKILLQKYNARVEFLENEIEQLQGAEGIFKDAEQNLKLSQEKNNRLQEIDLLKKNLSDRQKQLQVAEKNYNDAYKKVEHLRHLQREGRAAILAKNLSDGEPCPVCGAIHHPNLAKSSTSIPSDEEIEQFETVLKRREIEKISADKALSAAEEKIKSYQVEFDKLVDVLKIEDAQKNFIQAKNNFDKLKTDRKNLQEGKQLTKDKQKDFEKLQEDLKTLSKSKENLQGVVETMQKQIPQEYLNDTEKISADLRENQQLLEDLTAAWKKIDAEYQKLLNQKSSQEGEIKSETKNYQELSAKIEGKVKPDIDELKKIFGEAQEVYEKSFSQSTEFETKLKQFAETKNKFDALKTEIEVANKNFEMWQHLSDAANGKLSDAKISFRRSYLQSIFRDIVEESNARLDRMSEGRYKFIFSEERINNRVKSGGLDIKIFDAYTGKARIANTLSGGESFLAALSLALGLAAVVKNISGGVKLDTLFIDEGFGSLDSEALDAAIEVLEGLQVGGRLVGIISHVDELKQRLPVRLEVKKSQRGSSVEFVK